MLRAEGLEGVSPDQKEGTRGLARDTCFLAGRRRGAAAHGNLPEGSGHGGHGEGHDGRAAHGFLPQRFMRLVSRHIRVCVLRV